MKVTAKTFEGLAEQIEPVVREHPDLKDWYAQQLDTDAWVATAEPPVKHSPPHRAPRRAAPIALAVEGDDVLRGRIAALERRAAELERRVRDERWMQGADRDFLDFMDRVGWTERIELLS